MDYTSKHTVMIIEDNPELLESIDLLLNEQYHTVPLLNGIHAMEIINNQLPDLILIDILLPFPLDGFSILRLLKCNPNFAGIPVILMSALSDEKKITEGLELGANDYLVKPFSNKHLHLKVNNLLSVKLADYNIAVNTVPIFSKYNIDSSDTPELNFKFKFDNIVESLIEEPMVSVNYIAEKMLMSVSSLERWVTKIYGITPMKYLQDVKLVKAEMLLRQKNINVKKLSFVLGFNSDSYFCYCFKKKYGMSPKAFSDHHKTLNLLISSK